MQSTPSVFLLLLAIAGGLLVTAPAGAATLSVVQSEALPRLDKSGNAIQKRSLSQTPEGINLADCRDDQRIRFTVLLGGFVANGVVEAWASYDGASCSEQTARSGTAATCWPVQQGIPLQPVTQLDVPVRRLVSGALDPARPREDASVCGALDRSRIAVHFLYFEPGQLATASTTYSVAIPVDMVAGEPPAGLVATSEAGRVRVSWEKPREQRDARVDVYCAPVSHVAPTAAPGTCPPMFAPRSSPEEILLVQPGAICASVGGALDPTTTIQSSASGPLEDGVEHTFSIAGIDDFGNVSDPSPPACAAAGPSGDGGDEGGGCAVSRARPGPAPLLAALGVFLVLASRRRRARTEPRQPHPATEMRNSVPGTV